MHWAVEQSTGAEGSRWAPFWVSMGVVIACTIGAWGLI